MRAKNWMVRITSTIRRWWRATPPIIVIETNAGYVVGGRPYRVFRVTGVRGAGDAANVPGIPKLRSAYSEDYPRTFCDWIRVEPIGPDTWSVHCRYVTP